MVPGGSWEVLATLGTVAPGTGWAGGLPANPPGAGDGTGGLASTGGGTGFGLGGGTPDLALPLVLALPGFGLSCFGLLDLDLPSFPRSLESRFGFLARLRLVFAC